MLTQVHDIQTTLTRTPLEAALLENERIKALSPPYNVQLLGGDPRTWFCSADLVAASTERNDVHRYGPLPSTFSVRALGAISALLSGESPTRSSRARAVGVADRWAPDEAVFASGFADFTERHALDGLSTTTEIRRSLVVVAKKLLGAAKAGAAAEAADLESDDSSGVPGWDAERVVRHLERGVALAYQLLQRARWLCLLYDSAVVFREPPSEHARLLLLQGGSIVDARDLLPSETVPAPLAARPLRERQSAFDRALYDRLRTLTTELKRVLRDKGTAEVRVGRGRWLRGSKLEALLLWV